VDSEGVCSQASTHGSTPQVVEPHKRALEYLRRGVCGTHLCSRSLRPSPRSYHGDSDLQLERIDVYYNEAMGGRCMHREGKKEKRAWRRQEMVRGIVREPGNVACVERREGRRKGGAQAGRGSPFPMLTTSFTLPALRPDRSLCASLRACGLGAGNHGQCPLWALRRPLPSW
jgi:hypothetical protein